MICQVFERLADAETILLDIDPLTFYQNVSTSKELRDASTEAENTMRQFGVEAEMRIDVFKAKQAAQENISKSDSKLSAEQRRLVEKMILDGTRAGLALPEDQRNQLSELKKELSKLCVEFGVSSISLS